MSHDRSRPTPQAVSWFEKRFSAVLITGGMVIAFFLWTWPNLIIAQENWSRLPALWETSRIGVLVLFIKLISPLLVALLFMAWITLWRLITPYLRDREGTPLSDLQSADEAPALIPSSRQEPSLSPPLRFPQPDPITPLPPILDDLAPFSQMQTNEEASSDAEQAVPDETCVLPPEQNESNGEGRQDEKTTAPVLVSLGKQYPPYEVRLTLLKQVSMTLCVLSQNITFCVDLPQHAKRVHLLAYIAWQRGQTVKRDRMLEQVFGHGKSDEEATTEQLDQDFDSHKKLMRKEVRDAIAHLNATTGQELMPPDLDIFERKNKHYWLSPICRVTDLEEIEKHHQIIDQAQQDGLLVDHVPDVVKISCDQLIAVYSGDFLEELVTDYLEDFEPWTSSWVRTPYTLFRDYYLQARWYAAEYETLLGQHFADLGDLREQRKHWDLAAGHYRTYAMHACKSRFDTKVTFGGGRAPGERVIMSERALRRCLTRYGAIGSTHLIDQVYAAYYKQMRAISAKAWEPSRETLADLEASKKQTDAYRFPRQVTSHETLSLDHAPSA